MAAVFRRSVIIKPHGTKHSYWGYRDRFEGVPHSVILESEEGKYNLHARIEVEPHRGNSSYVHLRFFNANKYCRGDSTGKYLVADSDQPEEDVSKLRCTLFEPVKADEDGYVYLIHVHTRLRAQCLDEGRIVVGPNDSNIRDKMLLVDWKPKTNMVATFPRFIIVKPSVDDKFGFWSYVNKYDGVSHSVVLEIDEGMRNPHAKIEMKPTESNGWYVHLRFCNANKYCCFRTNSSGDKYVVAYIDHPEEDLDNPSCTLFEPVKADDGGNMYLIHVYTGLCAQGYGGRILLGREYCKVLFVDWESVVKLPEHVAFKGENGKYLQVIDKEDHPYLQFSSDDPFEKASGFRVYNRPDGYVRIKSDLLGKFWRLSPNWIWADCNAGPDDNGSYKNLEDAFWPIKIDEKTIVLRNGANNNYCKGLTIEGKTDCLNAAMSTTTKETRMELVELVQERKVYQIIYRLDEAQIFDKGRYVAGKATVINREDVATTMEVEIGYEDERSYTFNRSVSLSLGVTTKIEASLLGIFNSGVELSSQMSGTLEWGSTTTTKTLAKAKGIVSVPPNSMAVVHYVGTKATCSVPYSYVQQDKSSTDGKFVYTTMHDGVYTGVNCFDFDFIVDKALKLDQEPTEVEMLIGVSYNHKSH